MKFKATYWRGNPQIKGGGYTTERTIEAKSTRSAEKKALDISAKCLYGSMELLRIEKMEVN